CPIGARGLRASRCRRRRRAPGRYRRARPRAREGTAHSLGSQARRRAAPRTRRAPARPAPPRGRSTFGSSSLPLLTSSYGHDQQHETRQGQRQHADVQDLERRAELLDAAVEIAADGPELLADPELLVLEAADLGLLLRRQQQRRRILALLLELAEPPLRLRELVLQPLLRRAELRVRFTAQRFDARERPRERRAAPEPDQVRAARQVVERVHDEVAVARERRQDLLT